MENTVKIRKPKSRIHRVSLIVTGCERVLELFCRAEVYRRTEKKDLYDKITSHLSAKIKTLENRIDHEVDIYTAERLIRELNNKKHANRLLEELNQKNLILQEQEILNIEEEQKVCEVCEETSC